MKKLVTLLLSLALMLSLVACGGETPPSNSGDTLTPSQNEESTGNDNTKESTKQNSKQSMSISEFENLLAEQPLYVSKTKYVVQDDKYKSLYPDMLQAVLSNSTTEDIKDAVVAFVAWDNNNLPVKIKGQFDFGDGTYIKQVNYADINLIGGDTFGENSGFSLDENNNISTFKAIAVSFVTFNGETWENPYYDDFCAMYEGEKYSDSMTVEVKIVDSTFSVNENVANSSSDKSTTSSMTASELESNLSTQPITIVSTDYIVQDEQYKSLYPDMLQAVLQNNTADDIKNAVVAFVAWDKNNLPVKIVGQFDFSDGTYVKKVNYADINLAAGDTFGESSGFSLDENCEIETFKAIVVSYETFDGDTWENPYYEDFCSLYEGKKLS